MGNTKVNESGQTQSLLAWRLQMRNSDDPIDASFIQEGWEGQEFGWKSG
jgi:hypothetical protein